MKLLFFLLTVMIGVPGVFGQAPPPPPPPLIYSAPSAAEIKEFVETQYKFKVSFPAIPDKVLRTEGNVTQVVYTARRKGSNSSVAVVIFPADMTSHADRMYEAYKSDLAKLSVGGKWASSGKSVVTLDRELTVNGTEGREFGYESDLHFTHVAIFVKGNLFFEVKTDVTNWHILTKWHPDIVREFNSESARFIASFGFLP